MPTLRHPIFAERWLPAQHRGGCTSAAGRRPGPMGSGWRREGPRPVRTAADRCRPLQPAAAVRCPPEGRGPL